MTEAIATQDNGASVLERVVVGGDLSRLDPHDRMLYYKAVCESVGLNPFTRPFDYIQLSGKLTLYAKRDATDQLRKIHGVSIAKLERETVGGLYIVTAHAVDKTDRTDASSGAVNIEGLRGEAKANAIMKAETKAKRRVTLSICGLGMLDESETDSVPGAVVGEAATVTVTDISAATEAPDTRATLIAEIKTMSKALGHTTEDRAILKREHLGDENADLDTAELAGLKSLHAALAG